MNLRYLGWQLPCIVLAAAAAGVLTVRHFDADRSLKRSWRSLLQAVDDQSVAALRPRLDANYADRWGYTAESLVNDARHAFFQAQRLALSASDVTFVREKNRATITAVLKLDAVGPEPVTSARVTINALFSPCTFEWRREPDFPWAWKLTRFEHPDLELRQLGRNF